MKDQNTVCGVPLLALLQLVIPEWLPVENLKGVPGSVDTARTLELTRLKGIRLDSLLLKFFLLMWLLFTFGSIYRMGFRIDSDSVSLLFLWSLLWGTGTAAVTYRIWWRKQPSPMTLALNSLNDCFLKIHITQQRLNEPMVVIPFPKEIFVLLVTSRYRLVSACEEILYELAEEVISKEYNSPQETRVIAMLRDDFSEHFEAASTFGLTKLTWNPYFNEARKRFLAKRGVKTPPEAEAEPATLPPTGPGATVAF